MKTENYFKHNYIPLVSILIPVYNFDVRALVQTLVTQCRQEEIEYEVLCYEDGSFNNYVERNKSIKEHQKVTHKVLEKNQGRSKIRNQMSAEASYDWQLFMDCDSLVERDDYIARYVKVLEHNEPCVVFGGRTYSDKPPLEWQKRLRWKYGKEREVFLPTTRCERPYKFFMTNNFLAHREIMNDILFNEKLTGYGHEDTVFAQDLKRASITVLHIDNPLRHIGLENADEFLMKTDQGIRNLVFLYKKELIEEDNRLVETYQRLSRMKIDKILGFLLRKFRGYFRMRLTSKRPSLFNFDLFKLSLFLEYVQQD